MKPSIGMPWPALRAGREPGFEETSALETTAPWIERARRALLDRQDRTGAWGDRVGGSPSAEATALAGLALKSEAAARWLASQQREDGSVPAAAVPGSPGWPTPHAMLLWSALGDSETISGGPRAGGQSHFAPSMLQNRDSPQPSPNGYIERPIDRAISWLLGQKGTSLDLARVGRGVLGHDPALIGWPWVDETCSWLEPTAMAVLALRRVGLGDHFRTTEGVALIVNRAVPGGGWNYGNNVVFGAVLRPQIAPTAIALLALEACSIASPVVDEGVRYLRETIREVRAPVSLGWGVRALRALRACPDEAELWLEESFERHARRPDATLGLALLLLASRGRR